MSSELERHFHIKWAGPNTPYIRFCKNDERIYLTKREVVALMHELEGFVHYYDSCFSEENIDNKDD